MKGRKQLLRTDVPSLSPPQQRFARRHDSNPVGNGAKDDDNANETEFGNGMRVDKAAEQRGGQDADGHDDGKKDGSKMLDRVKDEELSHRGANAKQSQVQNHFGVRNYKTERRRELFLVHQRDEGKNGGKGIGDEHHLEGRHLLVQLKHARLPLTGKRVEEQEENEKDDSAPGARDAFWVSKNVFLEVNLLGRIEKQVKTKRHYPSGDVFISLVRLVVENLAH